jgi:hypothetical protein
MLDPQRRNTGVIESSIDLIFLEISTAGFDASSGACCLRFYSLVLSSFLRV